MWSLFNKIVIPSEVEESGYPLGDQNRLRVLYFIGSYGPEAMGSASHEQTILALRERGHDLDSPIGANGNRRCAMRQANAVCPDSGRLWPAPARAASATQVAAARARFFAGARFSALRPGPVDSYNNGERRDFAVPFAKVPELGLELVRLTRDVKVQETLVTLLIQQVEQVRIAEAKDFPVAQVLDRAVAAERHSRPRMGVTLAVAAITGVIGGALAAFVLEYAQILLRNTPQA